MRGKAIHGPHGAGQAGITPACAGKRFCSQYALRRPWDHPRVCGEKRQEGIVLLALIGSPPRVRGKACHRIMCCPLPGITPACAGKRSSGTLMSKSCRDHPRVCGEKSTRRFLGSAVTGSPPRVRGKVLVLPFPSNTRRITPACAGKSEVNWIFLQIHRDHPRVCGEKQPKLKEKLTQIGSPPRVRGKVLYLYLLLGHIRITPACAGKSRSDRTGSAR